MTSHILKLQVLQKSIQNLHTWLDKCHDSVDVVIPLQDFLEADPTHLTQLALQYKDLLLKLKERYAFIQEMKCLLKELTEEAEQLKSGSLDDALSSECAKIAKEVAIVNTKWSTICQHVKQQYSKLSTALAAVRERSLSPVSPTGSIPNNSLALIPTESLKENGDSRVLMRNHSKLDEVVRNTPPPSIYMDVSDYTQSTNAIPSCTHLTGTVSSHTHFTTAVPSHLPSTNTTPEHTYFISTVSVNNHSTDTVSSNNCLTSASTIKSHTYPSSAVLSPTHSSSPASVSSPNRHESLDNLLEALKQEAESSFMEHPVPSDTPVTLPKPSILTNSAHKDSHNNKPPLPPSKAHTLPHHIKATSVGPKKTPMSSNILSPPPKPARTKSGPIEKRGTYPPVRSSPSLPTLEKTPSCRLSKKLEEMAAQVDVAEGMIMRRSPCHLHSMNVELRLSDMRESLTILDLQVEELGQLNKQADSIPNSPSPTRPGKAAVTSYTLLELACCKETLSNLYHTVKQLQSVCNEHICNMELVLELILQFEEKVADCQRNLTEYEKIVAELRNCMLEGNMQPWSTADKSLELLSHCKESLMGLSTFYQQLLSLEPHFNGTPVRDKVSTVQQRLHAIEVDAEATIHSAVNHRMKFTEESLAIVDDWLKRTEEDLAQIEKTEKGISIDLKQNKSQEVDEHLTTLQQTSEQLQLILNLSVHKGASIPRIEEVRTSQEDIAVKREQLLSFSVDITKLEVKQKEDIDLTLMRRGHSIKPYDEIVIPYANKQSPLKRSVPVYTEIEPQTNPTHQRRNPIPPPLPVYSEIVLQPNPLMEKEIIATSENSNETHIPSSFPSSLSPRTIVHSSSEMGTASPSHSPTPPPPHVSVKCPTEEPLFKEIVKPLNLSETTSTKKSKLPEPTHDYDIPRPSSMRVVLMEFIDEHYTEMADIHEIAKGFKTPNLDETLTSLPEGSGKSNCESFLHKLRNCQLNLESLQRGIGSIQVPCEPLLSTLQEKKEQCNVINAKLDELSEMLSHCNEHTAQLHTSLSSVSTEDARVNFLLLQLESELFDVSCLHHRCQMKLREKLHELKKREKDISSLQMDLKVLSQVLEEAKDLLVKQDCITDVNEYLNECKEMHLKLAQYSTQRQEAASKIRNLLLASTCNPLPSQSPSQSPPDVGLQLLEQLRHIETQWVNAIHDLMNIHQLETILVKQMLHNIAKELKSFETVFPELTCNGINLENLIKKRELCDNKLTKSKALHTSLLSAKARMEHSQMTHGKDPVYDHPRMFMSHLPGPPSNDEEYVTFQNPKDTSFEKSKDSTHVNLNMHPDQADSISENTETHAISHHSESVLPQKATGVGSIRFDVKTDYNKLLKTISLLIDLVIRAIAELESKFGQIQEWTFPLERFWTESNGLSVWINETKVAVKEKKGIAEDTQALVESMTAKKQSLSTVQDLAKQVLAIPSCSLKDRDPIKTQTDRLVKEWQVLFRCLPLNVQVTLQPSEDPLTYLKPPEEFDDISQMVEWLILVESKLQPHPMIVGDTTNVTRGLHGLKTIEKELQLKSEEYHQFMKSGRHSDHSDSDSSSPTLQRGDSPAKSVKFIDENTMERNHRRKQIEQDNVLDTMLSEDDLDSFEITGRTTTESKNQTKPPSPPIVSPTLEEVQQLSVLWNGVWGTLAQRKQALESVLDMWSGYESKKTTCKEFLDRAERKLSDIFVGVGSAESIDKIHKEITELKTLSEETPLYQHKIGTLNDLTTDLIQRYKNTDSTEHLQQSMTILNVRWKKVHESYLQEKTIIDHVTSAWFGFYQHYQPLVEFIEQADTDLSLINPSVKDVTKMQCMLDKIKVIQKDFVSWSGGLAIVTQYNVKLQEVMSKYNSELTAVNTSIEKLKKQWNDLTQLAEERYQLLERGLAERQDIIAIMSGCETWIKKAEEHVKGQKPLTADVSHINAQLDVHKEFESELTHHQSQLSLATARARLLSSNFTTPNSLIESMDGEEIKKYFDGLENNLYKIRKSANKWKSDVEAVFSAMEEFQLLSTQFSQNITELKSKLPADFQVSATLPGLKQQLESWQQVETNANAMGHVLETMVASQRKIMTFNARPSSDAVQLVKKFHKQLNDLHSTIATHIDTINKTMWKFDPNNVAMALPRGWVKAKTAQGTQYYIDTLSGNHTQWQHPELSELYHSFTSRFEHSFYPSSAYPIALRLRCIQTCIQFEYLPTQVAMDTFDLYNLKQDPYTFLSSSEMTEIALSLFHKAAASQLMQEPDDMSGAPMGGVNLDVNRAVELSVSWIQDVFDLTHTGMVNALSFQISVVCLSSTKMDEKHKALFHIMSRGKNTIDQDTMLLFLETLIQIPQSTSDTQYCTLDTLESHVSECFRKYASGTHLHSVGYIAWAQGEPLPISWLPILHRMAAAETMEHNFKCSVCQHPTIIGFRYKCLQCTNFNMCQECYWSGKTAKDHDRSKHFMEEYCISPDERGLFFRTLGNRGRKKSPRRTHIPDPGSSSPNQVERDNMDQLQKQWPIPMHKNSQTDYHLLSLKREMSPSMSSLSTANTFGSLSLERHGSLSYLPGQPDTSYNSPFQLQNSYDATTSSPRLDEVVKLKHEHIKRSHIPVSHSFDNGRVYSQSTEMGGLYKESTPPPLPPRNPVKKQIPATHFNELGTSPSSARTTPERSPLHTMRAISPSLAQESTAKLRKQVEALESHNKQLEDFIAQLKAMKQ